MTVGWEHIAALGLAIWSLARELQWGRRGVAMERERRDAEATLAALGECKRAMEASPDWERRFWEQFHAIEGIVEERNQAFSMYRQSTLLSGNAQDMLMRELQRTLSLLNDRRQRDGEEPLRTQPALREAYEAFLAEREAAARSVPVATISRDAPPSLPGAE